MSDLIDVLVAGAGPVGLFLACNLAACGCSFRIVEKLESPQGISKASGVLPRTLEVLRTVGLADRFVDAGQRVRDFGLIGSRGALLELPFDHLDTPYPFLLGLEQFKTEGLLAARLEELGGRIERGVELSGFEQDESGVTARLTARSGAPETVRARYLVGCDGAHSTVRHALGLPFEGSEDPEHYVVAYLSIDWEMPQSRMFELTSKEGSLFGIPLREGRWSVAGEYDRSQWKHDGEGGQPELSEVEELFRRRSPFAARLREPRWMSYYRVHHRQAPRYQVGRVFLAGDAAHIHSPLGGQGMNTGLQDVHNLAWKLAFVCRGLAPETLLASYHDERHPVGRSVVRLTSFLQAELNLRSRLAMALRDEMTEEAGRLACVRNLASRQLGELAYHYRHSPIVAEAPSGLHLAAGGPRAGDRAPDGPAPLVGNGARSGSLYDLFERGRFTLLLFEGTHDAGDLLEAARSAAEEHGSILRPVLVRGRARETGAAAAVAVVADGEGALHHRYGARGPCLALVRPDGYIAFRAEPADVARLRAYLCGVGLAVPAS